MFKGDAANASISTTTADVRSGAQAMKVTGGGPSAYCQADRDFAATRGTAYTISGWIKTSNIQAGRCACLWLEWYNSSNTKIGSTLPVGATLTGTNPYTFRQATNQVAPTGTSYGRVICRLEDTIASTACFDDVHVK